MSTAVRGETKGSVTWPQRGVVGSLVDQRVSSLQERVRAGDSSAVAMMAHLRHAAGKPAGSVPDVWPITLAAELVRPGDGDEPSHPEIAVHIALTLYAVHQQSRPDRMHRRGVGFGRALRALHPADAETDPIRRRFQAVGTADSLDELVHHARGLVQLLRAAGQPLDYGLLADQLHAWQRGDEVRVRLVWARDFYRTEPSTPKTAAAAEQATAATPNTTTTS